MPCPYAASSAPLPPASGPRVVYEDDGVVACAEAEGQTMLDVSITNRVPHFRECGGRGRCTTCRVHVFDGLQNLSERTAREAKIAAARGWLPHIRLACQTAVHGDVRVRRLIRTPADVSLLQTEPLENAPGREVEVAILVCDIRQFTPFVDAHLSFDVVHLLNRFFNHLGEPILLNSGHIYQYVGDEMVGLFGLRGGSAAENALRAVRAGLGMLSALDELNASIEEEFGVVLDVGIGIHLGTLVVGHVGHASRKAFSVVGDAMNVASRIEAATRPLGVRLLASEAVLDAVELPLRQGLHRAVPLKGKAGEHTLVEILGFARPDADLLVQRTAHTLLGDADRFGALFYDRLFAAAPETRALFDDVEAQQGMLTETLRLAVYGLSRFETVAPGLAVLGSRHRAYGIEADHYDVFDAVFLDTLREALGDACTPDVEAAWADAIGRITAAMKAGAGPSRLALS